MSDEASNSTNETEVSKATLEVEVSLYQWNFWMAIAHGV